MINATFLTLALSFTPVVIDDTIEVNDGIAKETTTISFGPDAIETTKIHDVYQVDNCSSYTDVVWMMPVGFNIDYHEVTGDMSLPYTENFLGAGAERCIHWIVVDDLGDVPNGYCESALGACDKLGEWGYDIRVELADYARGFVFDETKRPAIGGYVAGAMLAGAIVNERPDDYSGLALVGGTPYSSVESGIQGYNAIGCDALSSLPPFITYDTTIQFFDAIMTGASTKPFEIVSGPEAAWLTFVGFPLLTYDMTAYIFNTTHINNGNWPAPNYVYCTPDGEGGYEFCDEDEMLGLADVLRPYAALGYIKDITCELAAGEDSRFIDNLHLFDGNVFATSDALAFGPTMDDYLNKFTEARRIKILESEKAEADRLHAVDPHKHLHNKLFPFLISTVAAD